MSDISEKRLLKEGRHSPRIGARAADHRVSTFPSVHGERAVQPLQEKSESVLNLEVGDMQGTELECFAVYQTQQMGDKAQTPCHHTLGLSKDRVARSWDSRVWFNSLRSRTATTPGLSPNRRLNSRLNCEALS